MAVHRGRIDLLEDHLRRDPELLTRTFTHGEIYPPELGCHDEVMATHGTPLDGGTMLHLCADYGEIEISRWLLAHGMKADQPAVVDGDGFGGHTALFGTVVSQASPWLHRRGGAAEVEMTRLLLDHGANPNARASLRKRLHPGYEIEGLHVYRDVSVLEWGERFVFRALVNVEAMRLIRERGGGHRSLGEGNCRSFDRAALAQDNRLEICRTTVPG
jgi:ankyrin repeat protein